MKTSVLYDKSLNFAIRIVNLYQYLVDVKEEKIIYRQLLRSGTAIGALISEGKYAESKLDFVHKYGIAQKECSETDYWITLLYKTDYLSENEFNSLIDDDTELMKLITSSIITAKKSIAENKKNKKTK